MLEILGVYMKNIFNFEVDFLVTGHIGSKIQAWFRSTVQ